MRVLLSVFVLIPILEMWLLIKVGAQIGALNTIFLVLLTAIIGVTLLRQQGLATLLRANQRLERGELPASELLEGICLAVGGALLLTPGFITDGFGFCCLIAPLRRKIIYAVLQRGWVVDVYGSAEDKPAGPADSATIEGEFRRERD